MSRKQPLISATALGALIALASPALAEPILVTSSADTGEGSLRAALTAAAAQDAATIILTGGDIAIETTLAYDGTAPLTIMGTGQTISSTQNVTLLAVTQGADLTISNVDLQGPGGFSIDARGDADGPAGKGLFVDVRDDQTGTIAVSLSNVSVTGTAGHGIHVSDCTLADECGGGGGGAGEGSPASIVLDLVDVRVTQTAFGSFDADGVRVDERGAGDILFGAAGSVFEGVGADGVELDEGQDGDVRVSVTASVFAANGAYCDPARLAAFMPDAAEGEFDQGVIAADAIPGPVAGSPDDQCFEREVELYDDGTVEDYEFAIDVDDGFDIDEAGPGHILATITDSTMTGNLDEGFDFDEEGPGGIDASFVQVTASGNTDDGYKLSEEDAGDVLALVSNSSATGNGGAGFVFEESDDGDVSVTVTRSRTSGNDDGELGLEVVQEDDGAGLLQVSLSALTDGIKTEGVSLAGN